jgi:hypothetical protein
VTAAMTEQPSNRTLTMKVVTPEAPALHVDPFADM